MCVFSGSALSCDISLEAMGVYAIISNIDISIWDELERLAEVLEITPHYLETIRAELLQANIIFEPVKSLSDEEIKADAEKFREEIREMDKAEEEEKKAANKK